MATHRKIRGKTMVGVDAKFPTSQTPANALAMVTATRITALTAIEPTYWEVVITSTVRMAQLSCGNRKTWVTSKASSPAIPTLIPFRTRRSPNKSCKGQCHFRSKGIALVLALIGSEELGGIRER